MEPSFQIITELYSVELQSTETKVVPLPSFPSNFQEIKDKIEELFSIPSCLQTVWVHGSEIHESMSCSPSSLYLQNGDTIKVSYPMKCEVEEVKGAMKWLSGSVAIFDEIKDCTKEKQFTKLLGKSSNMYHPNSDLEEFGRLFFPWTVKSKEINTIYFDFLGGIDLLIKILKLIIDIQDNNLFRHSKSRPIIDLIYYLGSLESTCCIALANIARNSTFCTKITESGGLDTCIQIFLKIVGEQTKSLRSAADALVAICNISDTPKNHLYISKRKDMLSKLPIVLGRPLEFSIWAAHDAINILLNVTTCKEAHSELQQPKLVQELIQSLDSRSLGGTVKHSISMKMLFWYAAITLAQMVLGSSHLLQNFSEEILGNMIKLMKDVSTFDPELISQYEVSNAISWTSFEHVLFLYEPDISSSGTSLTTSIKEVSFHSTEVLLHSFQCTLGRKQSVDLVIKEGLMEYFIILPWSVPHTHQEQARSVVKEIAKFHQIQPPSLNSLSKAKLAKMKWGLKKYLDMNSVSQIISN